MLCKTNMRAALAPVLAIVGLFGAAMANAQAISIDIGKADGGNTQTFALETLSGADGMVTVGGKHHVKVASSTAGGVAGEFDTWLELDVTTDIVLTARSDEHYYIRYDLQDDMVFTAVPPQPLIRIKFEWDPDEDAATDNATSTIIVIDPQHGTIDADGRATSDETDPDAAVLDGALAFGGGEDHSTVIFRLPKDPIPNGTRVYSTGELFEPVADGPTDYPVGTTFSLRLPVHLAVPAANGVYGASVSGYEDLSEARRFTADSHGGAALFASSMAGGVGVITIRTVVDDPSVVAVVAVADVATPETLDGKGGPFRRFVDGDDDDTDVEEYANLASVSVGLVDMPGYHARDNMRAVTVGDILTGASVKVTAEAGDFAVGTFRLATGDACAAGNLTLGPDDDDDMAPDAADATEVSGTGTGMEWNFCLNVADNEAVIPEVGDPDVPDGYMMEVTPGYAESVPMGARMGASDLMNAGSIDHNGTTVHITYLSASDRTSQRLVIVNRGSDPARFWMDKFQPEDGAVVAHRGAEVLAQGSASEVPGLARMIVRVQDNLSVTPGPPRTAGTLIVAAPTRHIDVMTVQVVGGTLDTTVYEHAE